MVFQNHLQSSVGREGEGVFPTPWQSKLLHIADFTIWESDEIMICICIANWDPFPFWGFNSIQVNLSRLKQKQSRLYLPGEGSH